MAGSAHPAERLRQAPSLAASRATVSALACALRRLLVLACAWLPWLPAYADKTALGMAVGHTARALAALAVRHEELHGRHPPPFALASRTAAQQLDEAGRALAPAQIRAGGLGLLAGLRAELARAQGDADALYDEATAHALGCAQASVAAAAAHLVQAGWHGAAITLDCRARDGTAHTAGPADTLPPPLAQPRMPPALQASAPPPPLPLEQLLASEAGICRLLHFVYAEIEIPAAQVCCRNIVEFGHAMPLAFTLDMARQVFDEGRHAAMAQAMLQRRGGRLGDFPFQNLVWNAYAKGDGLAEKLAIEQLIGEGNGLDMSEHCMDLFRARGLDDLLAYYRYLQVDEVNHCIYGNRWIRYLAGGDEAEVERVVRSALRKTGGRLPGPAPVRPAVRRAAAFSEAYIGRLLRVPGAAGAAPPARGAIVWLTGLSGAGKSTVARALDQALKARGSRSQVLDGDILRQGLCRDLGFSARDRSESVRRAGEAARLFLDGGTVAIGALISPFRADRAALRAAAGDGRFIEVYCRCPLAVCEARDPKGLYRQARSGALRDFTGIDSPYEEPEAPELVLDTATTTPADCAAAILHVLEQRGAIDCAIPDY